MVFYFYKNAIMKSLSLILLCFYCSIGFAQFKSDSTQLATYYNLALLKQDSASFFLDCANQFYEKKKSSAIWEESNDYLKARYWVIIGRLSEADSLLQRTIKKKAPQDFAQAKFYNLLGSVCALKKENAQAIHWYKKTLIILDKRKDSVQSAYIKSNIANIFFSTLDYKHAHPYLKEAYRITSAINDSLYGPSIEGMFAISLLKMNQKESAFSHAENALRKAEKYRSVQALVIANYVLGECYLEEDNLEVSEKYFRSSLDLAENTRQTYYVMLSNIGLLLVCNEKREFQEAIQYGNQALNISGAMNNTNTLYSVYKNLAKAYAGNKNHEQAYIYLSKAHQLFQKMTSLRQEKTMQELLVKYETEKKENELSKKELDLTRALNWILILIFSITLLIGVVFWIRKRNRSRIKLMNLESERYQLEAFVEGEQRERERLAADIHDGIASTLTGLALQIQQIKSINEISQFADHLQQVRNEVRLISKNISPFNFKEEGWSRSFQHFLDSIKNTELSIFFIPQFDESLLNNQRGMVVYRMMQELVQNTLKHAEASECELLIVEEGERLMIHFSDNGKGVSREKLEMGNGWQSIQKRLSAIHGIVIFPKNPLGGFKIDISLPKS
jgi:two-component system, NarL family, sensor kinase